MGAVQLNMLGEFGVVGVLSLVLLVTVGITLVILMNRDQAETARTEFHEIPGKTNFAEDVSEGVEESKEKEYRYDPEDFY